MRIELISNPLKHPPVPYRPGIALPSRITARLDNGPDPYIVELDLAVEDRQVICRTATIIQREDGPPVQSGRLRKVPIDAYIRFLIGEMAMSVSETTGSGHYRLDPASDDQRAALTKPLQQHLSDDLLRQVAKSYREAQAEGRPPRKAVEESLGKPTNTVARWIRAARDRGLLEDTPRGAGTKKGRS